MRYLIISVLVFIATNCFAINQKLIDDIQMYETAVKNLERIERKLEVEKDEPEYWSKRLNEERSKKGVFYSLNRIQFCQNKIIESRKEIRDLSIKYNEAKKEVKRLEPIRIEYNRQVDIENRRSKLKTAILNISGMVGVPLAFFIVWLFFVRWIVRRNKRLLKTGKMTKEQYRQMMQGGESSMFEDRGINPSTGLPLTGIGISDVGGNVRGSSDHHHCRDY